MKTPEEIKKISNQWAIENADETMATNSSLNRGFIAGYTLCQQDNCNKIKELMDIIIEVDDIFSVEVDGRNEIEQIDLKKKIENIISQYKK